MTVNGYLAITPPEFHKIEAEVKNGVVRVAQRVELREETLVFGYTTKNIKAREGDKVIIRGDSGLKPWAKAVYRLGEGTPFVLCPESDIVGFRIIDAIY